MNAADILRPTFREALRVANDLAPNLTFPGGPADWEEAMLHAQALADRRAAGHHDPLASGRDLALQMLSYLGTTGIPSEMWERFKSGLKATLDYHAMRQEPLPEPLRNFGKWCDVVFELINDFAPNPSAH